MVEGEGAGFVLGGDGDADAVAQRGVPRSHARKPAGRGWPRSSSSPRTASPSNWPDAHLFGAYEQDGAHFLFSIPEIIFEAGITIYTLWNGFRPSPVLDDSRYGGSLPA
ncbi:MAG TPA: hypothetical protein VD931_12395 [Baekduia sp.]|nr:hypothetical protein [Baekduia sp.]